MKYRYAAVLHPFGPCVREGCTQDGAVMMVVAYQRADVDTNDPESVAEDEQRLMVVTGSVCAEHSEEASALVLDPGFIDDMISRDIANPTPVFRHGEGQKH